MILKCNSFKALLSFVYFFDEILQCVTLQRDYRIPSAQETVKKKEWSAAIICGVEWKELNISAQMANTMGNTKLILREGVLHGYCQAIF